MLLRETLSGGKRWDVFTMKWEEEEVFLVNVARPSRLCSFQVCRRFDFDDNVLLFCTARISSRTSAAILILSDHDRLLRFRCHSV